jgi:putative tRNA adenosine deaminase-associated protein
VAYFTAVIARSGDTWKARDVEVDDAGSLDELADALRQTAIDDQPVIAVIEHEDEWFALVRVDGDDEPRLFVSDLGASTKGHYAGLLAGAADVDVDADADVAGDDENGDAAGDGADGADGTGDGADGADGTGDGADGAAEDGEPAVMAWAGDADLLDDLGTSARALRKLAEEKGDDPGAVLAEIGEVAGFADLLEALR